MANFLMELGSQSSSQNTSTKRASIFNLTSQNLDENSINLLEKGLKFVPTPTSFNNTDFQSSLDIFTSNLCTTCDRPDLPCHITQQTFKLVQPSFSRPAKISKDPVVKSVCDQISKIKPKLLKNPKNNMAQPLYKALQNLKTSEYIIKEADKGSAVVLMDEDFYSNNILAMLSDNNTYEQSNLTCSQLYDKVKRFCKKWSHILTKDDIKAITNHSSDLATIYGLPKIHKSSTLTRASECNTSSSIINCPRPTDLKFRPIISCRSCPSTKLCEVLNNLLQPFMKTVKYRLRDTWDFLSKIPSEVDDDTFLMTADITSLYTNITTEKGCEAISYFFDLHAQDLIPAHFTKDFVIDLFTFCQENLYFKFKETPYRQKSGTGMGRIYAPAVADLTVGYLEVQLEDFIRTSLGPTTVNYFNHHYFRYLDDIFLFWRHSMDGLDRIKDTLNSLDPQIKFTFESSLESDRPNHGIPFLDVELWIDNHSLVTDIYSKSTDTYNYLPFNSSHPRHVARNIPYCLARRIRGIVSQDSRIPHRMNEMKDRLQNKGYPVGIIDEAISKAMTLNRTDIIKGTSICNNTSQTTNPNKDIYFVTTFNARAGSSAPSIAASITGLNAARPYKKPIKVKPSFNKSPSLKDQLMFRPLTKPSVRKCGKDCTMCKYLQTGEYITLKNGKRVTTNGNFECSSRNVVYIATCSGCSESYIGETGDELLSRFAVHRQQSKLHPSQAPVQADVHFRLCGKGYYKVYPFFRPRKYSTIIRRNFEELFIKRFQPLLNGNIYG